MNLCLSLMDNLEVNSGHKLEFYYHLFCIMCLILKYMDRIFKASKCQQLVVLHMIFQSQANINH